MCNISNTICTLCCSCPMSNVYQRYLWIDHVTRQHIAQHSTDSIALSAEKASKSTRVRFHLVPWKLPLLLLKIFTGFSSRLFINTKVRRRPRSTWILFLNKIWKMCKFVREYQYVKKLQIVWDFANPDQGQALVVMQYLQNMKTCRKFTNI